MFEEIKEIEFRKKLQMEICKKQGLHRLSI